MKSKMEQLSERKRYLLAQKLMGKGKKKEVSAINRRNFSRYPMSFAQQRLWFLDKLLPERSVYNIPMLLRLSGRLNIEGLEWTLNRIIERHEILRTQFSEVDGEPMQHIAPHQALSLPLINLRELAVEERDKEALLLVEQEARTGFDLQTGPLVRGLLIQVSDDEYVLCLNFHHIVTDGWSMSILMKEINVLYQSYVTGTPDALPDLQIQYGDFAIWQREFLQGEALEKQLSYWRKQLSGELPILHLPTDRPRPAIQTHRGDYESVKIPDHVYERVKEVSAREGVSPFMTLLTVFQTLLYRYTGQEDLLVGTPVANRNRSELESVIGFFINTLVLRTDLSDNPSFRELLSRVRNVALDAFANQDVPFEKLVEELHPERSMGYSPLFQVMFVLQNAPKEELNFAGVDVTPFAIDYGISKFDLTLAIGENGEGLEAVFEYNTDLFDRETIQRMAQHFVNLLDDLLQHPDRNIAHAAMLTKRERQQLLVDFNSTAVDLNLEQLVYDRVAERAALAPNSVAVVDQYRSLTFRELNEQSNQLAHYLQNMGIGAGAHVGVLLERSVEFIISILAVLKSGAAYIPIDSNYPADRIQFMLEDSQAALLLTQSRLLEKLPSLHIKRFRLDADWNLIEQESISNPESHVTAEDTAYLIYTSGSTGVPKGVKVLHRGLLNLAQWTATTYCVTSQYRCSLVAGIGFDVSVWECWSSLIAGSSLYIADEDTRLSPESLRDWIIRNQLNISFVPTAMVESVVNLEWPQDVPLRAMWTGGDRLYEAPPQGLPFGLYNHYGPTEITVLCTATVVDPEIDHGLPPIGRAIANTEIYVLDAARKPVPIGVPGELYVGGAGVSGGYHNRPELTAEKFVPHPFHADAGKRVFKTGDRVRYLPDGRIDFIDRIDNQVKIRGFRIELSEIENTLGQVPSVQEAVVLVIDHKDQKRLVAYIVKKPGHAPKTAEARLFLKTKLPEYMVPSSFVWLDQWPMTVNGKVDRRALMAMDLMPDTQEQHEGPQNAVEELLSGIWSEVLHVERVGRFDNFFEVGGHSLLATQVTSRIRTLFGIDLPVRTVFEAPTVAELTVKIQDSQNSLAGGTRTPIMPVSRENSRQLSYSQQRLWFLDHFMDNCSVYNSPVVLRFQGPLDSDAIKSSLDEIVRRHEILRTTFQETDDHIVEQVIYDTFTANLHRIDLSHLPSDTREQEAQRILEEEARRPFDLSKGPLFRSLLVSLGAEEHALLLNMHHIVSDGWSLNLLLNELSRLYQAFRLGQPSPLSELTIQYADYAAWQREQLQGEHLQQQLHYWKTQLSGAPQLLQLPTDRPRPKQQSFKGAFESVFLPQEDVDTLRAMSQKEGVTLFMSLLAAFQTLLYRYSGQTDLVVGSPVANRHYQEIEGLIGFFVNTLVLRSNLDGNPTFRELLQQVRETALAAYAHQDLPFEKLVEELSPERTLGHTPLFQVMFVLQNAIDAVPDFEGLNVTSQGVDTAGAKFDLTLNILEGDTGLHVSFGYSTDLFDASTIQRMAQHFVALLKALTNNIDWNVGEVPFMSEQELHQVLVEWNQTATDYPQDKCLHQLFEEQAQKTPDAIAVVYDGVQLTYQELDQRANQVAHYLQKQGVTSETLVGLCVKRSVEMIVGLLGILKAGGAYVPMDPALPTERLAYMLEDTCIAIILTQQEVVDLVPAGEAKRVCLDTEKAVFADEPRDQVQSEVHAGSLAYVMYTSGSTGRPKGVMIMHRGVCNEVLSRQKKYQVTPADRVLHKAHFVFDASVWEIFLPLVTGARLVIAQPDGQRDHEYLIKLIRAEQITMTHFVPSMLKQFLEAPGVESCTSLRHVFSGGEPLSVELHDQFHQLLRAQLNNRYGPTESTINVTAWACHRDWDKPYIPIGRPIANTKAYVLDAYLHPVPIGVPGELLVSGPGLARGYLNSSDLTEAKFIPNPFASELGERLYRTGDLVRLRPDGNIEFLGRIDNQVKVRGYRIEPHEIESALLQLSDVREAVVVARNDRMGNKRLIAYLVGTAESAGDSNAVRLHLKSQLPDYMIPSVFMWLDALPLSAAGKVSWNELPEPEHDRSAVAEQYVAPRTEREFLLTTIWADVLGVANIGVFDNFFELGGDSILSIQIVSRAKRAGLVMTPKHLFEYQTVAELAMVVQESRVTLAEQGLLTGPVIMTPIQRKFFQQELPNPHHWNQSMMMRVRQPLDAQVLQETLRHLIMHHDALRLRFSATPEGWNVVLAACDDSIPLRVIDLSQVEEPAAVIASVADEVQGSLDLTHGPLFQVVYFELGAEREGRLLWVIHHLAVDGVSWRILLEDLQTAYEQASAGQPVTLPSKTTSFRQWAVLLEQHAQSIDMIEESRYWIEQGEGWPSDLPVDDPSGSNTEADLDLVKVSLNQEETLALLQRVPKSYRNQINEVLLCALVDVMTEWTQQQSLAIYLEGHGREEIFEGVDLSRTVGWFTSKFPVVLTAANTLPIGEQLKQMKEQLRSIPHKGIGYGILRYLSNDQRLVQAFREMPEPQVSFNYLGQFDQTLSDQARFAIAYEDSGRTMAVEGKRQHLLDVMGGVSGGELQMIWAYSTKLHQRETIERLAKAFVRKLRDIINHCESEQAFGYTPSDFPLAELDQSQMDRLLGQQRSIENVYPVTPLQQGLIFHSLYEGNKGDYITQMVIGFTGGFDQEAFCKAWGHVIQRHAILRTSFHLEELQVPHQVVHQHVELPLTHLDWSGETDPEACLDAFMHQERMMGFDFAQAPMMRMQLIRLSEDTRWFVWTRHHVMLDGWSLALVWRDFLDHYHALCAGETPTVAPLHPYREYIAWMLKQDMNAAESFWRNELRGYRSSTPLPLEKLSSTDEDRARVNGVVRRTLSTSATQALQQFARSNQLTLNTVMQGAWAVLLSQYSAEEEVVFGVTSSGRPTELNGVESMVGLFINTLPLRVHVKQDTSIVKWLQGVQEKQLALRHFEYSPLVQIQGWSQIPRGVPLFESIVVFENYPVSRAEDNDRTVSEITFLRGVEQSSYPLTLAIVPGTEVYVQLMFNGERYEETTIDRIADHFLMLLEELAIDSARRTTDLPCISEQERTRLLFEWNDTQRDYPSQQPIHLLFEAQVERSPDQVAVRYGDDQLTYRELNERANQLAHRLQGVGIGTEDLVGITLEPSVELIVSLLAVLKAGGAYVPIAPDYPMHRKAFMLEDTRVKVLITNDILRHTLPAMTIQLVLLDHDAELLSQESCENPLSEVTGEHLAYVIYTSGSTGTPKGVAILQKSVNRLVCNTNYIQITPEDRIAQASNTSFDAATFEIWGALLNGATLVGATKDVILSPLRLQEWIEEQQISVLFLTTALVHQIGRDNPDAFRSLRVLLFGGEAVESQWIQNIMDRGKPEQFLHVYGPTESTTFATYHPIENAQCLPIGRPIANTQAYILDDHLQPVPIGVQGELYIGGDGLAREYLNRTDLTDERFIPHPFVEEHGAKLYRTGDVVRSMPDGAIEFVGRVDHQVKIRGFRIELGEVETALRQLPEVLDAVVLVRDDLPGGKQLVAYLEGTTAGLQEEWNLRKHLQDRLPVFMIPSLFFWVEQMPLTVNGKVDREQLKAIANEKAIRLATHHEEHVEPRDQLELEMLQIWEDALGLTGVGMYDDFFDVGGNSFVAMRLISKINRHFDLSLSVSVLFHTPCLADMCTEIRKEVDVRTGCAVLLKKGSSLENPVFMIHPGGGGVYPYIHLARALGQEQTVYGIQAVGYESDAEQPLGSVAEMVKRYMREIRRVRPTGPYRIIGWSLGGIIAYEITRAFEQQGERVELMGLLDTYPFGEQLETYDLPASPEEELLQFAIMVGLDDAGLQALDVSELRQELLDQCVRHQVLPHISAANAMNRMLNVLIACYRSVVLEYRYSGPIQTDLHVFIAEERRPGGYQKEDFEAWQTRTAGGVEFVIVSGNHDQMVYPPHVQGLADQLKRQLQRVNVIS